MQRHSLYLAERLRLAMRLLEASLRGIRRRWRAKIEERELIAHGLS